MKRLRSVIRLSQKDLYRKSEALITERKSGEVTALARCTVWTHASADYSGAGRGQTYCARTFDDGDK